MSNRARPTLSPPPRFSIETADAESEDSFMDVFELMLELHKEGGYAPLDTRKAAGNVYSVMGEGMTFLARIEAPHETPHGTDPAGLPVGVLALTELPFWYGADSHTHLLDLGFYVLPRYRRGKVGVRLLMRARQEAQARSKVCLITVTSPDRRPRPTRATIQSQMAGFVPLGYTLRLN
jgi:GNAT superfamily N-acetyltransferase